MTTEKTFTTSEFTEKMRTFLEGVEKIALEHRQTHYPNLACDEFTGVFGKKYVKVIRKGSGSRSVHCFVDQTNGDVLKAACWAAPAKHARGNIFDKSNGLASMGPYGPAYLR